MASTESTEDMTPRDRIYMSGEEEILLVHELLDPNFVKKTRSTGQTTRLALKYAELALKVAPTRVRVIDHFPADVSHRHLIYKIGSILGHLSIDYDVKELPYVEPDPTSFTGVRSTGEKHYYIRAYPNGFPKDEEEG